MRCNWKIDEFLEMMIGGTYFWINFSELPLRRFDLQSLGAVRTNTQNNLCISPLLHDTPQNHYLHKTISKWSDFNQSCYIPEKIIKKEITSDLRFHVLVRNFLHASEQIIILILNFTKVACKIIFKWKKNLRL